mmetsp:Transcript_41938/g.115675  ORF Transcript_41938/g.115675 Transcript_41938/m.115675 type:complete len:448 (+) Transcript_41938:113-1456(+)
MAVDQPEQHLSVNFGKRLAHTDKKVRDKGIKVLKTWLQKHPDLERLEYMKLWRGLYFCMWMSDKRPVQQELAVNVALLVNDVPEAKRDMWIDTFWETMQTAWEKLDVHRINKYLLFTRIVIAEAFKALRIAGWPAERLQAMGETFARSMPGAGMKSTQVPSLGFILQFLRIFWAELLPELGDPEDACQERLMPLLEPFCAACEASPIRTLVARIHEHILRQAPRGVLKPLVGRLLTGATRADILKSHRALLYETVETLEKVLNRPKVSSNPGAEKATQGANGDVPRLVLPDSVSAVVDDNAGGMPTTGEKRKRTRRGGKRRKGKGANSEMSPLVLPESAVALADGSADGTPTAGKKRKAARRGGRSVKRKGADKSGADGAVDGAAAPVEEAVAKPSPVAADKQTEVKPSPLMLPKAVLPLRAKGRAKPKKGRKRPTKAGGAADTPEE